MPRSVVAHDPSCLRSNVIFPVIHDLGTMLLPHTVFSSPNSEQQPTRTFLSTSCFSLLTWFPKMLISVSAGLGTSLRCQSSSTCFNTYGVTELDLPANSTDQNVIKNQWDIVKIRHQTQQRAEGLH
ncbi:hypothetical protein CHARACLAT_011278 [Characodon lateralis]|uniref:Uncharacterized protein n=1 Tax=Characodon lateralis TaxID=208331 RepID=A0ABU7CZP3_9TELE|nr:hypothetical protein [Characodon lateralis]